MKLLIIPLLMLWFNCSGQTFRVDSIGHREGHTLPLFEKSGDTIKVYYWKIWGIGKTRVKRGMIGTIVRRDKKYFLTFKR